MSKRPLLVIATPQGQLGNTLTHFAHIRSYAITHKLPLVNLAFGTYAELFPAANRDLFSSYTPDRPIHTEPLVLQMIGLFKTFLSVVAKGGNSISPDQAAIILDTPPEALVSVSSSELRHFLFMFGCAVVEWINAGQFKQFPIELVKVEGDKPLLLGSDPRMQKFQHEERALMFDGWLIRDDQSFNDLRADRNAYFAPRADIQQSIAQCLGRLRSSASLVIGVHIRRGDYRKFCDGKYFWAPTTYCEWMRELVKRFPDQSVAFLVCSDEKFDPAIFSGLNVGFGPGTAVGDLYALAACDVMFGPPSTFTNWAHDYSGVPVYFMQAAGDDVGPIVDRVRSRSNKNL